jgi:hypothetical protein
VAFAKYAYANIIKPDINMPVWDRVRDSAQALGSAFARRGASKVTLGEFTPKDYLLTHCTIVASVDTENGPKALGRHLEDGFTVDRRFQDYYITAKTSAYINSNHDAWERKLLLASFRTFVGGENYVEHLQLPEMSKGKIVDACARDIGDSVYIDILVATARKHRPLIAAINSKQLQTLSMGCNVSFTACTKCGNVAADETELCAHIKYEKGNTFLDILGTQRKIAELCGNVSEPNSNKFIEASWVGNPAFKGAVVRNILSPEEASLYNHLHTDRLQVALSAPPRRVDRNARAKAARTALDFGDEKEQFPGGAGNDGDGGGDDTDQSGEGAGKKPSPKVEKDPLDSVVKDLAKALTDRAVQKIRQDMGGKSPGNEVEEDHSNNNLIPASASPLRQRLAHAVGRLIGDRQNAARVTEGVLLHRAGGWRAVEASRGFSGRDVLAISRVLDLLHKTPTVAGEARIYRTVLAVGGAASYVDVATYLTACGRVLGREPTQSEKLALITKGRLFDLGI